MNATRNRACARSLPFLALIASAALGADWPQWRGPQRDGTSPEVPRQLPRETPLWKQPVDGDCHAGVIAAGKIVIAVCHSKTEDQVRCFDAEKGTPLWTHTTPNATEMQYGSGPRATPLINGGRVYALTALGELICLNAADGQLVWKRNLQTEFAAPSPTWGYCSSPIIAQGKLIVSPLAPKAGIAALDPATGATLWQTPGAGQAHSSYIFGTFGGREQLIGYDGPDLAGWDVGNGKQIWSVKPENAGDFNVGTPVAVDGKVLVATDNNFTRIYAFDANGCAQPKPAAVNEELSPGTGSPVYSNGAVFGSGNDFLCIDPKTLKTLWVQSQESAVIGFTAVAAGNERLLVVNEDGVMALLSARTDRYELIGKMKLCGKTWSAPALANGRLFIRDAKTLYCYGW